MLTDSMSELSSSKIGGFLKDLRSEASSAFIGVLRRFVGFDWLGCLEVLRGDPVLEDLFPPVK